MSTSPPSDPSILASPLSLPNETDVLSLLSTLEAYLPYSLPLYRRLQFYLAHPSDPAGRPHAQIFQASGRYIHSCSTESISNGYSKSSLQDGLTHDTEAKARVPWLAAHADLSHSGETQVWIFANWECPDQGENQFNQPPSLPNARETEGRRALLQSCLRFIYNRCVPLMPLTPSTSFNSVKKLRGNDHPYSPSTILIRSCNMTIRSLIPDYAIGKIESHYLKYIFPCPSHKPTPSDSIPITQEPIPPGYRFCALRHPQDLQRALDRTDTPRTLKTLALMRSRGIFYMDEPDPIAWGFVGIDASLTTLHTEPEHRRKSLAVSLARELLRMQAECFKTPNHEGDEGEGRVDGGEKWGHADVLEANKASRRVMEKAGGEVMWRDCWVEVELGRLFEGGGLWNDE